MNTSPNIQHLCRQYLRKGNLEKCFDLLHEAIISATETKPLIDDLILQEGRLNFALRERNAGRSDEYNKVYNQISDFMISFLERIEEKHLSLLNRINDQILIVCPESKKQEWQKMFNESHYSHTQVIVYDQEIPSNYLSPDVVIFDDSGPNARPHMVQFAEIMPQTHFLYYGDINPFSESRKRVEKDAIIFNRCANANSKFTVHARLLELLDFRKKYGLLNE